MNRAIPRLLLGAALCAAQSALSQQITIGTSPQATAGYAMGSAIAKLMTEKMGAQARVQPFTGNSLAVAGMNRGEIDFSVVNEIEVVEALNGEGAYQGRRQGDVRMAALLYPFPVTIFVRKDSPIHRLADLKGKRLPWGYTAMVTLKRVVGAILANAGLGEADIEPVLVPNINRGADDFASGKADAFFFALGPAKVTEVDAAVGGLRALAVSDAPADVARMQAVLPQGYVLEVKPRPGLAGVAQPTKALAYDYTLVVGKHVAADVVYKVVKLLADNKPALVESFRGFSGFDPKRLAKKMDAPFHPGAERYLKEAGQWPPR